jgi:hypothetical protein
MSQMTRRLSYRLTLVNLHGCLDRAHWRMESTGPGTEEVVHTRAIEKLRMRDLAMLLVRAKIQLIKTAAPFALLHWLIGVVSAGSGHVLWRMRHA